MSQNKLAILGGQPVLTSPFQVRKTIREEDVSAVNTVLQKGDLSLFFGSPGDFFLGGPFVKEFEAHWRNKYQYKHAISVNSWTTGLMTAIGAIGIEPGDEVICTPYSMSATATSILFYGGIPVFADIEDTYFNLDPKKIEEKITSKTKALMLVHLFGHPAKMNEIMAIAKRHNLKVIEDAAHAPGAKYKGEYVGAIGDIGGFSFNYHKHIHCGEGGLLVTHNDDIAKKCQLIRNHGENCIEAFNISDLNNIIGSNYRLTEIQAAIAKVQSERLDEFLEHRNTLANQLTQRLNEFDILTAPKIDEDCTHSFYIYPLKYNWQKTEVPRETFIAAVNAELPKASIWEQMPLLGGYTRPLYLNPIYQKKQAIGKNGFPWSMNPKTKYDYSLGSCPVVERMHFKELLFTPLIREAVTSKDIDMLGNAIEKVVNNINSLKGIDLA